MSRLVRLVALVDGRELGAIDGEELTISVTEDAEIQVSNGHFGLNGAILYGWEDLVPDYRIGDDVRLELQIVEADDART